MKIEVEIPDELLAKLKCLARERGWSVDEAVCRGVVLLLKANLEDEPHVPASSSEVGWNGLSADALRELALADETRELPGW